MRRAVIQDQLEGVHPTLQSFWNEALQQEGLEVYKALAFRRATILLSIGDTQRSEQMEKPLALVARRDEQRLTSLSWAALLLSLAGLDGGLLICAHHPNALCKQFFGPLVQLQDWPGTFQEGLWIVNVLPEMVPPGLQFLLRKPATKGAAGYPDHQPQCH